MKQCIFCDIISSQNGRPNIISDTILYEDKHFIIKPALGALTDGYLMVVPKRHVNSISELFPHERVELFKLLKDLKTLQYEIYKTKSIIWENAFGGRFDTSIVHCHLHVAPVTLSVQMKQKILNDFNMQPINLKNKISKFGSSRYFLFIDENEKAFITEKTANIPRQHMRKFIAEELKIKDLWNWREFPLYENVEKTINQWEKAVKNSSVKHRFSNGLIKKII